MSIEEDSLWCKVVLLGESGVGKTSIIFRYIQNIFKSKILPTPGANFVTKIISLQEAKSQVKFEIWDTPGNEKYRSLAKVFFKNAKVFILVYDIANRASFEELKKFWIPDIKNYSDYDGIWVLVGNKNDINKKEEVGEFEGKILAEEIEAIFQTTSAKDSTGIEELFLKVGKRFISENSNEGNNPPKVKKSFSYYHYENISIKKFNIQIKNLNDKIIELEKENKDLKDEKTKLNNKNLEFQKKINILKKENTDLLNKLNNMNNNISQNNQITSVYNINDEIISLMKKLEMKENEIKSLKEGTDLLPIIFRSTDQKIHYSIKCRKTDRFNIIENKLYDIYPQYQEGENMFYVNGNKIIKSKTISDNNIKYSDIITVIPFENE